MRSDKEVENDLNKTKKVVNDEVEIKEVDIRTKNDDEGAKKGNRGDAMPPKDDELKVDIKTLPFPQRFIRHNLDK